MLASMHFQANKKLFTDCDFSCHNWIEQ